MSQATDYVLANQSGANFRSELNSVLAAVSSTNSGSTAPTTMYAYMMWVDTGVSPALLKLRNGANNAWITLGDVTVANLGLATLASPTLTGTPLSTTAAVDTNTTQIATTAYVLAQAGSATPLLNGTAAVGTSTRFARQDHVHGTDTTRAPLASPTFTGTVTIPAGTAFVDPTITGTILEDVFTITDGAAFEVDPSNGSIQLITLGASRTPKATNFAAGESITLMVNDGTAYTLTWTDATWGTGGVIWTGGSAPTLATTGYTVLQFWKVSTQVYGALVGEVA